MRVRIPPLPPTHPGVTGTAYLASSNLAARWFESTRPDQGDVAPAGKERGVVSAEGAGSIPVVPANFGLVV